MPEAVRLIGAALSLRRDVGDREDLAISLEVLADLLAGSEPVLSGRMLGAADALRTRHRLPAPADGGVERAATLAGLQARLGEEGLAAALAAGQARTLDAVVDEALGRVGAEPRGGSAG